MAATTPSTTKQYGKNAKAVGVTPSVLLINPKFPHNVGQSMRAASCFGVEQLWFTGSRVSMEGDKAKGYRLPREERMKGFKDVTLINYDYPFDQFPRGTTPVAVELRPDAELLPEFVHPENPLYVFGPEDGSIPSVVAQHCHRFVVIPLAHCCNLSAAVYMMLAHRMDQRHRLGIEVQTYDFLNEERGWEGGWLDMEKEMV